MFVAITNGTNKPSVLIVNAYNNAMAIIENGTVSRIMSAYIIIAKIEARYPDTSWIYE